MVNKKGKRRKEMDKKRKGGKKISAKILYFPRVVEQVKDYSLVEVLIETGRTLMLLITEPEQRAINYEIGRASCRERV